MIKDIALVPIQAGDWIVRSYSLGSSNYIAFYKVVEIVNDCAVVRKYTRSSHDVISYSNTRLHRFFRNTLVVPEYVVPFDIIAKEEEVGNAS